MVYHRRICLDQKGTISFAKAKRSLLCTGSTLLCVRFSDHELSDNLVISIELELNSDGDVKEGGLAGRADRGTAL